MGDISVMTAGMKGTMLAKATTARFRISSGTILIV